MIIQIGTEVDESRILWKKNENDDWKRADIDDLIRAYESIEPKTGWTPVSERLPKEYAQYLVCFENGECFVYWLEDSDWSRSVAEKEGILAWMPLPMPYREDGEA